MPAALNSDGLELTNAVDIKATAVWLASGKYLQARCTYVYLSSSTERGGREPE
jgi:hypothetical protein